jgi:hypothetical protein
MLFVGKRFVIFLRLEFMVLPALLLPEKSSSSAPAESVLTGPQGTSQSINQTRNKECLRWDVNNFSLTVIEEAAQGRN